MRALELAVDGGTGDVEQFCEFRLGVRSSGMDGKEVPTLGGGELGLFPAELSLALRNRHSFAGAHPDQISFKFRDHAEDIEKQPPHRVCGVVDRPAEAERDALPGEFVSDISCVGEGPGKSVEFGHNQGVAGANGGKRFAQPGPGSNCAGKSVVDVDVFPGRRRGR